jgi:phage terminase small subunit
MQKLRKRKEEAARKERIFIDEYLKCWNGAEAARRAGYSAATARQIAYNLLTKVYIKEQINDRLKKSAMSAEEVLARTTDLARGNMMPFIEVSEDGYASLDFSSDEAKDALHLIKKIKTKRSRRMVGKGEQAEPWQDEYVEVELYDSQRALETLAKYHNLLTEKDEDGNPISDEERIARVITILDGARARRAGQPATGDSPALPAGTEETGEPARGLRVPVRARRRS